MPISKSAKKSLRSSINKRQRNSVLRSNLKDSLKKATLDSLSKTYSTIDKAAKTHLINKNKAARLKSKLTKRLTGSDRDTKTVRSRTKKKTTQKKK